MDDHLKTAITHILDTINRNGSDTAKAVLSFGKDEWIVFDRLSDQEADPPMATVVCVKQTDLRFHLYKVSSRDATDALCYLLDLLGINVRIEEGQWTNSSGFKVFASRPISLMDTRKLRGIKCY
jgi:hypothetical protein